MLTQSQKGSRFQCLKPANQRLPGRASKVGAADRVEEWKRDPGCGILKRPGQSECKRVPCTFRKKNTKTPQVSIFQQSPEEKG